MLNVWENFMANISMQLLAQAALGSIQEFNRKDKAMTIPWLDQVKLVVERTGVDLVEVGISKLRVLALGDINTTREEESLTWYKVRLQGWSVGRCYCHVADGRATGSYYFSLSSEVLNRTSSHMWGRWYLPMFLFRDGLLTLTYRTSLMALMRFCSSLPTMLKFPKETWWPVVVKWWPFHLPLGNNISQHYN